MAAISMMAGRMAGPSVEDCSWFTVEGILRDKACNEYKRFGSCGCQQKRAQGVRINPCEAANAFADLAVKAGMDEPVSHSELENLLAFLRGKTCRAYRADQGCNHQGCHRITPALAFIESQITQRRKAA